MVARKIVALIICSILFSGCTEYWWTRGQPPGVDKLLTRATEKLTEAQSTFGSTRKDISATADEVRESLLQVVTSIQKSQSPGQVVAGLEKAEQAFIKLEGNVSIGSRAALGELSGQLRAFTSAAQNGNQLEYPAVGLFAARSISFLANELSVPAPAA